MIERKRLFFLKNFISRFKKNKDRILSKKCIFISCIYACCYKGTESIEAIKLDFPEPERVLLVNPDAFAKMKKLRLLIVRNADISGSRPEFLSNELRLLDWPGYPFSSLPSKFGPSKLVAVDLSYSRVKKLILCFKVQIFCTPSLLLFNVYELAFRS